jgi:riboflavin synthase
VFTGIVEELGKVISRRGPRLRIAASTVLEGSDMGASIAVNGCCLTLVAKGTSEPGTNEPGINEPGTSWWEADVSDETYDRTNLSDIADGAVVNLERPMALGERLGGHIVLGHVDGVGTVVNPVPNLRVRIPRELMVYLVEKGSVTVDGISLTAFNLGDDTFDVAIIPHTSEVTTLGVRKAGDRVNIEMDVLAKHVERLLEAHISR